MENNQFIQEKNVDDLGPVFFIASTLDRQETWTVRH